MNLPWKINNKLTTELASLRERIMELELQVSEQQQICDELEQQNLLQRKVFGVIPDLFAVIDENHRIIFSNWQGGYNYVPEAHRQGNPICYQVYYGRKTPCEPCHVREAFSSGEPVSREKINPKIGWVNIHAYPLRDETGKTCLVLEHIEDVSEKKQAQLDLQRYREHLVEIVDERTEELHKAIEDLTRENAERRKVEEALRTSEEKFRAVTETSPAAIILYQGEKFIYVNPSAERLTGYTWNELLEMRFWDWIHPDYMELIRTRGLARQQGVPLPPEYEFRFITKTGEERWAHLTAKCIEYAGKSTGIAVFVDITERKNAEERLRDSEEQFRVMAASAKDAIVMMDNKGCVSFWNEAAEHIFGYPNHEAMGLVIHDLLAPPMYREQYLRAFPIWQETGQGDAVNKTIELSAQRKDGSIFPIELSLSSVRIKGVWNAIAITRDISDRKQADLKILKINEELQQRNEQLLAAQEELVRKEKLAVLGQLSGSLAHELRNPLAVISNAVYFLKSIHQGPDERIQDYLGIIGEEIGNAERIISETLDFSRTSTPKIVPTAVAQLVHSALEKCSIPEDISLSTDLPETLPLLTVDPLQIEQVLQNLITNACQAMPHGGTVSINARTVQGSETNFLNKSIADLEPCGEFLEISVSDTGEGVSPENMKKLFQPLFTTKEHGIGLGLTLCRNLTETNGGRISAESRTGDGIEFRVILPVEKKCPQ